MNSTRHIAKIAGFAYAVIIVVSILNLIFVESQLVVDGDAVATANNIMQNPLLFRIGLTVDIFMFAGVLLLSAALYTLLKPVHKHLALLALLWRITEAIIGGVTVLFGFVVAQLAHGKDDSTTFAPHQLHTLMDIFLQVRAAGFHLVVFFLCLGTIVFCYLFWKSRSIPRMLSGLGIGSFVLMLVGSLVPLLAPQYAAIAMISYGPGIVFELAIGVWLFAKGVDMPSLHEQHTV